MTSLKPGSAILAASLTLFGVPAASSAEPGTAPAGRGDAAASRQAPRAASGLRGFYRKFARLTLSVDAAGSNNPTHTVTVTKPSAGAEVDKAFLLAASHGSFTPPYPGIPIANNDIKLNNKRVTWFDSESNSVPGLPGWFTSVVGDVTSIVKPVMDAAPAGARNFTIREVNKNTDIDGEILVVVFRDPSLEKRRTIALLFGGQQVDGDRFEITLEDPIDPGEPGARADMGLGISYSFQGTAQYSVLDVNGQRLTTSAGGADDGDDGVANGTLITAGGIGDARGNPPDPNAAPSARRTDDERYTLLPFIDNTTSRIFVDTLNPSDDDNIFFAWFDLSAEGDVNKDTDGDGLLDSWEQSGYDHDGDGTIDVPIQNRGANWRKKDIFIAYAWMNAGAGEGSSHQPTTAVLNAVKAAFAKAPVSNPNGSTGINLHFRSVGGVPHDDDLNEVWTEFDAIMNPLVSEAERRIYHRVLNAHRYNNTNSSGLSRGIPASDFIESLGGFSSNPGTLRQRAGTIMHELGHNLGLRHGGVDHENYKPNHLSVMSYANQLVWLLKNGDAKLDYERFDLHDLDETDLNEVAGLTRTGGDGPIRRYGVRWFSGGLSLVKNQGAHRNVNWNNNGSSTDPSVAVDLNNTGGASELRARFPEWANIIYDGGVIGAGIESVERNMLTSPKDLMELTYEEFRRMQRNVIEVE